MKDLTGQASQEEDTAMPSTTQRDTLQNDEAKTEDKTLQTCVEAMDHPTELMVVASPRIPSELAEEGKLAVSSETSPPSMCELLLELSTYIMQV